MRLIDAFELVIKLGKKIPPLVEQGCHPQRVYAEVLNCIADTPTVEGVKRGHWKHYIHSALVRWKNGEPVWEDRNVYRCSKCDKGTIVKTPFCPWCGTRLDGDQQ